MNKIDRYQIQQKLADGNKGTLYLGTDPKTGKRVAVKMLDRSVFMNSAAELNFMQEIREINNIHHASIVPIIESGKHGKIPFLVYEYVEGRSLLSFIQGGKPDIRVALNIFHQILDAISQAHRRNIVHKDLSVSKVIIASEGIPKIMGFGMARVVVKQKPDGSYIADRLRYVAPEYIQKGKVGTPTDVFSLGVILHEMLTGKPIFDAKTPQEIITAQTNISKSPPSSFNSEIDSKLDRIVLKALNTALSQRYQSAIEMLGALKSYRASESGVQFGGSKKGNSTIEYLINKMQDEKDFPALSDSITALNKLVSSDDESVSELASVIVKDFALTSKILKVVNSVYYASFSGNIGTVSRAIVVLGVDAIRSIAASLIFFDHLHNKVQIQELEEQTSNALFSAILARQTAENIGYSGVEESFLCALLHNLGHILVTYYLHDESQEIKRLCSEEELSEKQAQMKVLGTHYQELGMAVSRLWNFPENITLSMQGLKSGKLKKPKSNTETQQMIANFSNEVIQTLDGHYLDDSALMEGLVERYGSGLNLDTKALVNTLSQATQNFSELAREFTNRPIRSRVVDYLTGRDKKLKAVNSDKQTRGKTDSNRSIADAHRVEQALEIGEEISQDSETILADGLQELTNILLENYNLNQIFNVVLETMYRGMGFNRVILCLQDTKTREMVAKLGFGSDANAIIKQFRFALKYNANVFHAALTRGVDVYIANATDTKIRGDLPGWFRMIPDANCFILLPIVVNKRSIGLIYADHNKACGLGMTPKQLNLLKALRNQILLAFSRV